MNRLISLAMLVLVLTGCAVTQEREALELLPADVEPRPYVNLLHRARVQANVATESFYTDDWLELQDAARALEQTARYLPRAMELPGPLQKSLPDDALALAKSARQLREAARARDVQAVNVSLQGIHQKIRALHPEAEFRPSEPGAKK